MTKYILRLIIYIPTNTNLEYVFKLDRLSLFCNHCKTVILHVCPILSSTQSNTHQNTLSPSTRVLYKHIKIYAYSLHITLLNHILCPMPMRLRKSRRLSAQILLWASVLSNYRLLRVPNKHVLIK